MASTARRILAAKCHFEVLQLPPEQTTSAAVKQAYLKLAQAVHPDHLAHADAPKAFSRLKTSYEALQSNSGRTSHLMYIKRNPPRQPSVVLKVLEEAGSTRGLATAAAVFLAAECLRLAIADDATVTTSAPAEPPAPSRRATTTPRAPAFASNAGEPLIGASNAEIQSKVASGLKAARLRRLDSQKSGASPSSPGAAEARTRTRTPRSGYRSTIPSAARGPPPLPPG